jgi:hypothetical protein
MWHVVVTRGWRCCKIRAELWTQASGVDAVGMVDSETRPLGMKGPEHMRACPNRAACGVGEAGAQLTVCLSGSAPFICMKSITVCTSNRSKSPDQISIMRPRTAQTTKLCTKPRNPRENTQPTPASAPVSGQHVAIQYPCRSARGQEVTRALQPCARAWRVSVPLKQRFFREPSGKRSASRTAPGSSAAGSAGSPASCRLMSDACIGSTSTIAGDGFPSHSE